MHIESNEIYVKQLRELIELIGFETRNKYQIMSPQKTLIGYAAEQNKGILGFIGRQFLGHWRPYEIMIFDAHRNPLVKCTHPFRFFFQEFIIETAQGQVLGRIVQRFSIFSKKFDIHLDGEKRVLEMRSPLWKPWTFPVKDGSREVALIEKKWSGLLKEAFLDSDNFRVQFKDPSLSNESKIMLTAASFFVDLQYFEAKAD